MRQYLKNLSVCLLGLIIICLALVHSAQAFKVDHLSAAQARKYLFQGQSTGNLIILDIRTPGEYQAGHIKGAINVDFYSKSFSRKMNRLDKSSQYLIYCRSGSRTSKALGLMKQQGFTQVLHLKHGLQSWIKADYPLVK